MKRILLILGVLNLSNIFCSDKSSSSSSSMPYMRSTSNLSSSSSSYDTAYNTYAQRCQDMMKYLADCENTLREKPHQIPTELITCCINCYLDPISREQWDQNGKEIINIFQKENITNEDSERLKKLLESGESNLNIKNNFGDTVLIKASYHGYIEIVKLLLEQLGIDVNATDRNGYTALMWALIKGHIEIGKLLESKDPYRNREIL